MRPSIEIKGVVLSDKFNEKFVDLIRKLEYSPELEKFLKYFENEDVTSLSVNLFNSDDFGKLALCDFEVFTSGYDSYYYHINFNFNDDVCITIFDRCDNSKVVFNGRLELNGFKWDNLFILPNTEEENASEPEPPVEDAEEQENPELTPAEENIKLTPLEKAFFEKAYEIACDLEDENVHLDQHQVDDYVSDIFHEIMRKSKTLDVYHSWLDERKKQEALTIL